MTERLQQNNLTSRGQNPYPKGGDIFMSEPGAGEGLSQKGIPSTEEGQLKKPLSTSEGPTGENARRSENSLREAWAISYGYKKFENIPYDKRQAIGHLVDQGLIPIVGGAETIPGGIFESESILSIVDEINQEILKNGIGRPLDREFIRQQQEKIRHLLDERVITNEDEARLLLQELDSLTDEANTLGITDDHIRGIVLVAINLSNLSKGDENEKGPLQNAIEELAKGPRNRDVEIAIERLAQKMEDINERKKIEGEEEIENRIKERARQQERGFGMYLEHEDTDRLQADPIAWLDGQFDQLYKLAAEGQELSSPVVNTMQTVVTEAMRYLQYKNPKILEEFGTLFTIRFNLIKVRTVIGMRDIDSIKGNAQALGAHGLIYAFGLEEGRVGSMFNRMQDKLEQTRLENTVDLEHHVTPEIATSLQDALIEEQLQMAEQGIGLFVGKNEADITRAVRTAYDLFVATQRQAVIVARGRHLTGNDAYFSDPSSGPLNVYNMEELLTGKFGVFNIEEDEYLMHMKLARAEYEISESNGGLRGLSEEEKEDLGRRLLRDLFAVPDLFSSGWRIKGITDSIEERMKQIYGEKDGVERAKDFALFMRLKDDKTRKETWGRIARVRPEKVVELFRERMEEGVGAETARYQDLEDSLGNLFNNPAFEKYKKTKDGEQRTIKEVFNAVMADINPITRVLRENGYKELRQLNIGAKTEEDGGLTDNEKEVVRKWFSGRESRLEPEELQRIFEVMSVFAQNQTETLMSHHRFQDIYVRALMVDDAFLDQLEMDEFKYVDKNGAKITVMQKDKDGKDLEKVKKFTPLSKKFAADQGGDMYVRSWNDTGNAIQAAQSLVAFVKAKNEEKRFEAAEKFADSAAAYNGEDQRAKAILFTIGTHLELSELPILADALGIKNLPARLPLTKLQRIEGPRAINMSRDELLQRRDQIVGILKGAVSTVTRQEVLDKLLEDGISLTGEDGDQEIIANKTAEIKAEKARKAEKYIQYLDKKLDITAMGRAKRKALALLMIMLLFSLEEFVRATGATEGLKAA